MTVEVITEEERRKLREDFQKHVTEVEQQLREACARQYGTPTPPPPKIVYCMTIYEERMPQVEQCILRVRPYVDQCVIVVDDTVTEQSKKWLKEHNCEIYYRKWDNHFSKQRNAYLDHVNEGEWVLCSDPDELHSLSLMKDIRKICAEADKQGINILGINAHDITTQPDNSQTNVVSDWFKQLLFKFEEGVRYVGCVHETLLPSIHGWRPTNLDKRYYYEHTKSYVEIKERGARNVFCGGGGNNIKEKNPMYVELHKIATEFYITDWPSLRAFIRNPKTNSLFWGLFWDKLKEVIIKHRNDSGWDWENESRDFFLWCKALHSREFESWESTPQAPSKGSPPEVMAYVEEQYLKTLGRNADDTGKQAYTEAIIQGKIKREDLPEILRSSEEFKQKHGLGRN